MTSLYPDLELLAIQRAMAKAGVKIQHCECDRPVTIDDDPEIAPRCVKCGKAIQA